jgi:hypothetical protein
MVHQPERERQRPAASTVTVETSGRNEVLLCSCCEPANPLVLRPDLGTAPDGRALWALCVFHVPEPTVYRARPDGTWEPMVGLNLNELGELVDGASGAVVARVQNDGFQRLTTVDDDDLPGPSSGSGGVAMPLQGGSSPAIGSAVRVDLSQDEFYR